MKKYLFSFLGLALLASCSDDDEANDTTPPQILSVSMDAEDHDIEVMAGNTTALAVELSDNDALSQLKLDIHDLFDGHSHGKNASVWEMTKIYSVSGANATVQDNLQVPTAVVAGPYHAILQLVDASGNESDFKELEFIVRNGSEPQFSITAPDFSNEVHAPKGQAFDLQGTISDETDLSEILIRIEEEHEDDHAHKKASAVLYEDDIDLAGTSDLSFDLSSLNITIPSSAEEGYYKLLISAKDNEGNFGVFEAEIHIM